MTAEILTPEERLVLAVAVDEDHLDDEDNAGQGLQRRRTSLSTKLRMNHQLDEDSLSLLRRICLERQGTKEHGDPAGKLYEKVRKQVGK